MGDSHRDFLGAGGGCQHGYSYRGSLLLKVVVVGSGDRDTRGLFRGGGQGLAGSGTKICTFFLVVPTTRKSMLRGGSVCCCARKGVPAAVHQLFDLLRWGRPESHCLRAARTQDVSARKAEGGAQFVIRFETDLGGSD